MTTSRQVVKNAFGSYAGQLTSVAVGVLLTPILVHSLGDMQYGIWRLAGSLLAYIGLLELGFATAVAKYTAQYQVTGEADKANRVVSTLFFLHVAVAMIALLVLLLCAPLFPSAFSIPMSQASAAEVVLVIAGMDFALMLAGGVFNAVLVGYQRIDVTNWLSMLWLGVKFVLILVALDMGYGLVAVASIGAATTLLLALSRAYTIRRLNRGFKISPALLNVQVLKDGIFRYSALIFALEVTRLALFNIGNIVVGRFVGVESVTPYDIAGKIGNFILMLTFPLMVVLFPRFAEFEARRDAESSRRTFVSGTKFSIALVVPFSVFIIVMRDQIISMWVGTEFVSRTSTIVAVLVVFYLCYGVFRPAHALLVGTGRLKLYVIASFALVLVSVALSITLVPSYGAVGVALGNTIPIAVVYIGLLLPYVCRMVRLPLLSLGRTCLLPALAVATPLGAALLVLSKHARIGNLLALGVLFVLYTTIYGSVYIAAFSSLEQRLRYAGWLRAVCHRAQTLAQG